MWDHTEAENLMFMSFSTLHNSCYNCITRLVSGNIYASIQNTKYALLSLAEFVEIFALFGRTKQTKNLRREDQTRFWGPGPCTLVLGKVDQLQSATNGQRHHVLQGSAQSDLPPLSTLHKVAHYSHHVYHVYQAHHVGNDQSRSLTSLSWYWHAEVIPLILSAQLKLCVI